ncbi:MAG: 30S ribosomal protein S5, partial [Nanoarchaeota archaeon]|nr:30S ribosomal protein S5 [Nanoarchaeota archaeon]
EECQKLLKLAGVKDVYSKARGQTASRINLIKACFTALRQLTTMKVKDIHVEKLGIVSGKKE